MQKARAACEPGALTFADTDHAEPANLAKRIKAAALHQEQSPILMDVLQLRVGADFRMTSQQDTPAVFLIRPEGSAVQHLFHEIWLTEPHLPYRDYTDLYGNKCRRTILPAGTATISYDAYVEIGSELDPADPSALEVPIDEVPDEALVYTLPSRYCHSDILFPRAAELFGNVEPGWERVAAICDWVHASLAFGYGSSNAATTAADTLASGNGVCRDFAHLAISFCRALNIPARYAYGYLPDIDNVRITAPMDFAAWFEAYLGNRWWVFDPRNNVPRRGRVTVGRGRDALDVAMVTTFGNSVLDSMTVRADRLENDARAFV
jgi:transglutaminase-like putative cysteine protease